jgi:hypothetical protein
LNSLNFDKVDADSLYHVLPFRLKVRQNFGRLPTTEYMTCAADGSG